MQNIFIFQCAMRIISFQYYLSRRKAVLFSTSHYSTQHKTYIKDAFMKWYFFHVIIIILFPSTSELWKESILWKSCFVSKLVTVQVKVKIGALIFSLLSKCETAWTTQLRNIPCLSTDRQEQCRAEERPWKCNLLYSWAPTEARRTSQTQWFKRTIMQLSANGIYLEVWVW